ncbi:nucleoside diphosphate kinase regulator [Phreatobacter stygius]|uniref:Nucleoside diphosphate kinase regulator n=1 Tax=Phreatobacter stygius TaxID=1940610 RepID=A0A4D7B0G9_9HYPH|nr:nucleoside diphosphate kinase regulator [Phreatobacter stygius]QCI64995.1 nucleoside diphosphate kinase regulator [Phreatobacter stygius]
MNTPIQTTNAATLPPIVVSDFDHQRLSVLANDALRRAPEVAEALLTELDRAEVVASQALPRDAIGMHSTVEFTSHGGQLRRVQLVFPAEADIAEGKISIMTPLGAALIGLSPGQSFEWVGPGGHPNRLTVISVERAAEAGASA